MPALVPDQRDEGMLDVLTEDCECRAPARLKEASMSQSQVSFDPKVAVIEPPRCSKCNCPTIFTGIRSGPSGLYLRIFECPLCGYTEKIAEYGTDPAQGRVF